VVGRLDDAADLVELRALVDRYALAADRRDRDRFADVFAPDGVLDLGGGHQLSGAVELAAPLDYLDQHYQRTMHFVGNHVVTLDGDTASGLVYCLAHHVGAHGDGLRDSAMALRYDDRYVRTTDGWRIAHRTVEVDWEEHRDALPVQGPLSEL
jgi:uncharacterized protein (TIGR02246 family)